MSHRQTLVALECSVCGSRMKKATDPFAISDLHFVCPGCSSTLHVSAEDVTLAVGYRHASAGTRVVARAIDKGEDGS